MKEWPDLWQPRLLLQNAKGFGPTMHEAGSLGASTKGKGALPLAVIECLSEESLSASPLPATVQPSLRKYPTASLPLPSIHLIERGMNTLCFMLLLYLQNGGGGCSLPMWLGPSALSNTGISEETEIRIFLEGNQTVDYQKSS
jgi:hypothetical protein